MPNHLNIRPLEKYDLIFADAIRDSVGWNQTAADWRRLLSHEPEGCFLGEWDGVPAGVVTTIRYGNELAWIGMMLVHPDYRRRGIATALMDAAIKYLRSKKVSCIKLDATPDGAKVYECLGFRPELELHRWKGDLKSEDRAAGAQDLPLPLEFDSIAFGVDRSEWIGRLAADGQLVRILRDDLGNPIAFGMVRKGARANYVGPISAFDEASGRKLTILLLKNVEGLSHWDILEENGEAIAIAQSLGFQRSRPLLRMWTGDKLISGNPALQFGIADPGTG